MAETRDILFRILGDSKSLQRASRAGQKGLGGMANTVKQLAGGIGLAFGANELRKYATDAFALGAAAEEVDSKFEAVFGTAQDLNDALARWGDLAGVTTTDAKNLAATFGNLAMAQGLSREETEALTLEVAGLAGDLASFNDADPATVFTDLNKALLTTEREGMKKYGIAIGEAEVKTRAMAIATADGRTEVTKADRALASYRIAAEQAGEAVGDLERTQDSIANQMRRARATWKEYQELFGRSMVQQLSAFVSIGGDFADVIRDQSAAMTENADNSWWDRINDTKVATQAEQLADGINLIALATRFLSGNMKEADPTFKEFADTQRIIADEVATHQHRIRQEARKTTDELKSEWDEQILATQQFVNRLDAALSGDLFANYRRQLELLGLLGGIGAGTDPSGRDESDLDEAWFRNQSSNGSAPGS